MDSILKFVSNFSLHFENKPPIVYRKGAIGFKEKNIKWASEPKVTGRAMIHV